MREIGAVPTPQQIIQRIGQQLTNPNIYLQWVDQPLRAFVPRSQLADDEFRPVHKDARQPQPQPIDALLTDEVIHLAMRGLDKTDRKIFRMMLAGKGPNLIAKKLGLCKSSVTQRLAGVLWEARMRADLAEWLGVEPATEKVYRPDGRRLAGMSTVPPARLAIAG